MNRRSVVSIATVALASAVLASAVLLGCPADETKQSTTGGSQTSKPATTAATTAAASGDTKPTTNPTGANAFGKGVIKATVKFTGTAPEMKVPKKRGEAEFCKDTPVKYNAVVADGGMLQDVYVGIADGQLKGDYPADTTLTVDQKDCMYSPRIQGALPEQKLVIKNSDATLHNVNAGKGAATLFNTAQPKGAPDLEKAFEETGIYRMKCDVHSWMRAFVVVSDNPFHGVSGTDGTVTIDKVPDGKHKIMAWHSQFGKKEAEVTITGGEATVEISYDGTEAEPAENTGELNDLF